MFDREQGDGDPKQREGLINLDCTFLKREKPEGFGTVVEDRGSCKNRRDFLDPVKFTKADEMIVMAMRPDYCVDMRRSVEKELLPEIR
jgi:hypothetical protein